MDIFLLDLVDEPLAREAGRGGGDALGIFIVVFAATILVEALVMLLMKYSRFLKSLLDSTLVNIASLGAAFVLEQFAQQLFNSYRLPNLVLLCLLTILIEWPLLFLLNRHKPGAVTLKVAFLMNLATYFLFFLFTLTR